MKLSKCFIRLTSPSIEIYKRKKNKYLLILKTDVGNILFHLLEKFVRKQLTIVIIATPVILPIGYPHLYQNVHSPKLLKAISVYCGTLREWHTNPYLQFYYLNQ